jgi:hypothetical protein
MEFGMTYFLDKQQLDALERKIRDALIASGDCDQRGASAL